MKMKLVLLAAVLVVGASGASAATIGHTEVYACTANDTSITTTSCTANGATVTATNGYLDPRTFPVSGGLSGYGVSTGAVEGEIDGNEAISIEFAASTVDYFELLFLYEPPAYSDVENPVTGENDETAAISAYNGSTLLATLYVYVTGDTSLTLSQGPGTWVNLSPGTENNSGAWRITNPFGVQPITKLTFFSGDTGITTSAIYSDFALGTVSFTNPPRDVPVPEPTSLVLLGSGLGAALLRARRRKQSNQ